MKEKILRWLNIGVKASALVTGYAVYADKLPAKWAGIAALAFASVSLLKDTFTKVGDLLDDGQANDSFK